MMLLSILKVKRIALRFIRFHVMSKEGVYVIVRDEEPCKRSHGWKKIRKDEYIMDDKICRITKKKENEIKDLDNRHFNFGRFA
jgi:hypothetical protein